ncbi:MAG: hypothetical protein ABW049_09695 [Spongiibacteraceae bacterium]
MFDSVKEKAGSVMGSASELNKVGVDVLEKTTQAAFESYSYYNSVGIKQLRALASINSGAALRTFIGESISLTGEIIKHAVEDTQKNIALGAEVRANLGGIFGSVVKPAAPKKAAAAKGAAASV